MVELTTFARRLNARRRNLTPHLPTLWLMTDERRLPDPLPTIARLPPGSGVVFRHYGAPDRLRIAAAAAKLCRARRLHFVLATTEHSRAPGGILGRHSPEGLIRPHKRRRHWLTASVHSARALSKAARARVDAVFVAPVFATRSHPGSPTLGTLGLARLARRSQVPVIALGGLDATTVGRLAGIHLAGVAAIDGLARELGVSR